MVKNEFRTEKIGKQTNNNEDRFGLVNGGSAIEQSVFLLIISNK